MNDTDKEIGVSELLDTAIQLHSNFHMGKPGLSDKDFKDTIMKLMKGEL